MWTVGIKLFYGLRLRQLMNWVQRGLRELRAPRAALKGFDSPEDLIAYTLSRFEYREDRTRFWPWDWSSHPEVFQYRLEHPDPDGDCDDYHTYIHAQLERMGFKAYLVCVNYRLPGQKPRGHVCVVFYRDNGWWLVNYRLRPIQRLDDAPRVIAEHQLRSPKAEVVWAVFERPALKLFQIWTA